MRYHFFEDRNGFAVRRVDGMDAVKDAFGTSKHWDVVHLGHYSEPKAGVIFRFQDLLDEDEQLGRVVWDDAFLRLRLRCAEVL